MQHILIYIFWGLAIAWLLPPIKQYKTKFFYYFVVLAVSDPAAFLLYKVLHISMGYSHVIFSSAAIASLISLKINKYLITFLALPGVIFFFIPGISQTAMLNLIAFNIIVVIFIISARFIITIKETEIINLFYIVLLLYNISLVMKILFRVNFAETGYLYFFLTNFFQIFIAVYFTIYNVNNAKKIRLFRDEQTT